jgi:hypothetical protein
VHGRSRRAKRLVGIVEALSELEERVFVRLAGHEISPGA